MTLRWKPPMDCYVETTCNRYSVSRARDGERLIYTAWRQGRPPLQLHTEHANVETRGRAVEACKAACAADFAGDRIGRKP